MTDVKRMEMRYSEYGSVRKSRNIFILAFTLLLVLGLFVTMLILSSDRSDAAAPGVGTEYNPMKIEDAGQLADLAQLVNAGSNALAASLGIASDEVVWIELGADIDLRDWSAGVTAGDERHGWDTGHSVAAGWTPIGTTGGEFKAHFDGVGHKIFNLYINNASSTTPTSGLFGNVVGAQIRNFGIESGTISGKSLTGAIVGQVTSSSIANVYNKIPVSADSIVGGVVGFLSDSTLNNSYNTGVVAASVSNDVGGLVGKASATAAGTKSSIEKSYNLGDVSATGSVQNVGGILGESTTFPLTSSVEIYDVYNAGDVSGTSSFVAGIVGKATNITKVGNSVSLGGVSNGSTSNVGRISGNQATNTSGFLTNNYAWEAEGIIGPWCTFPRLSGSNWPDSSRADVSLNGLSVTGEDIHRGEDFWVNIVHFDTTNWNFYGPSRLPILNRDQPDLPVGDFGNQQGEIPDNILNYGGYIGDNYGNGDQDGSGVDKEIMISDPEQLACVAKVYNLTLSDYPNSSWKFKVGNKFFKLANDLDLAKWGPDGDSLHGNGSGWLPVGNGTGNGGAAIALNFDGNNHVIKNLYINRPTEDGQALFGNLGFRSPSGSIDPVIKNLGIESGSVYCNKECASLVSYITPSLTEGGYAQVINVYNNASVTSETSSAGGLVSLLGSDGLPAVIKNSYNTGSVTLLNGTGSSAYCVGGIAASIDGSDDDIDGIYTSSSLYNSGTVSGTGAQVRVGGVAGCVTHPGLRDVYNSGSVNLFGSNDSNSNAITRYAAVGGVVGSLLSGNDEYSLTLKNSYNSGMISSDINTYVYIGGLAGAAEKMRVVNSVALSNSIYVTAGGTPVVHRIVGRGAPVIEGDNLDNNYALAIMNDATGSCGPASFMKDGTLIPASSALDSQDGKSITSADIRSGDFSFGSAGSDPGAAQWSELIWEFHTGNGLPTLKNMPGPAQNFDYPVWLKASTPDGSNFANAYEISTPEQLSCFAQSVNGGQDYSGKFIKLTSDIDLSAWNSASESLGGGAGWTQIGTASGNYLDSLSGAPFKGTFDGDGHIISNLYINNNTKFNGLFGWVQSANLRNFGIASGSMTFTSTSKYSGAIVGAATDDTSIKNVYNAADITGFQYFGGIAGALYGENSIISNAYNTGNITLITIGSPYGGGGIVGQLAGATVSNTYNTGAVDGSSPGSMFGGVVGLISQAGSTYPSIDKSVNLGQIVKGTSSVHRVWGSGTLDPITLAATTNYAWAKTAAADQVNCSLPSLGPGYVPSVFSEVGLNKYDGADVNSKTLIESTSSFFGSLGWSTDNWNIDNNKLPTLKVYRASEDGDHFGSTIGAQSNKIPQWIQDDYAPNTHTVTSHEWGDADNPILIKTPEQLACLATLTNASATSASIVGKNFRMDNDIDLFNYGTQYSSTSHGVSFNSGKGWSPIGTAENPFKGIFDGNGYVINNLFSYNANPVILGLFGVISDAKIANLGVASGDIYSAAGFAGGVVGSAIDSSELSNVYNKAAVRGFSTTGGIVGNLTDSSIENAYNTGEIKTSYTSVGGIAGNMSTDSEISHTYNTGDILVSDGSERVGGIVGKLLSGTISSSVQLGRVFKGVDASNANRIWSYTPAKPTQTGTANFGWVDGAIAPSAYTCGIGTFTPSGYTANDWAGQNETGEADSNGADVTASVILSGAAFWRNIVGFQGEDWNLDEPRKLPTLKVHHESDFLTARDDSPLNAQDREPPQWISDSVESSNGGETITDIVPGDGTTEDLPYRIGNATQLGCLATLTNQLRDFEGEHFKMINDIDLGVSPYNSGEGWKSIGYDADHAFKGVFDGGRHTISNIYMDSDLENVGLFGFIGGPGVIKNLGIESGQIKSTPSTSAGRVGGIVGYSSASTASEPALSNLFNKANVSVYADWSNLSGTGYAGGIVGYVQSQTTISSTYNTGRISAVRQRNVTPEVDAGGIAGNLGAESTIINSYNTGDISAIHNVTAPSTAYAGGIAAKSWTTSRITQTYNTGNVSALGGNTSLSYSTVLAGGIVGYNLGEITNSAVFSANITAAFSNGPHANAKVGRIVPLTTTESTDQVLDKNIAYAGVLINDALAPDDAQKAADMKNGADVSSSEIWQPQTFNGDTNVNSVNFNYNGVNEWYGILVEKDSIEQCYDDAPNLITHSDLPYWCQAKHKLPILIGVSKPSLQKGELPLEVSDFPVPNSFTVDSVFQNGYSKSMGISGLVCNETTGEYVEYLGKCSKAESFEYPTSVKINTNATGWTYKEVGYPARDQQEISYAGGQIRSIRYSNDSTGNEWQYSAPDSEDDPYLEGGGDGTLDVKIPADFVGNITFDIYNVNSGQILTYGLQVTPPVPKVYITYKRTIDFGFGNISDQYFGAEEQIFDDPWNGAGESVEYNMTEDHGVFLGWTCGPDAINQDLGYWVQGTTLLSLANCVEDLGEGNYVLDLYAQYDMEKVSAIFHTQNPYCDYNHTDDCSSNPNTSGFPDTSCVLNPLYARPDLGDGVAEMSFDFYNAPDLSAICVGGVNPVVNLDVPEYTIGGSWGFNGWQYYNEFYWYEINYNSDYDIFEGNLTKGSYQEDDGNWKLDFYPHIEWQSDFAFFTGNDDNTFTFDRSTPRAQQTVSNSTQTIEDLSFSEFLEAGSLKNIGVPDAPDADLRFAGWKLVVTYDHDNEALEEAFSAVDGKTFWTNNYYGDIDVNGSGIASKDGLDIEGAFHEVGEEALFSVNYGFSFVAQWEPFKIDNVSVDSKIITMDGSGFLRPWSAATSPLDCEDAILNYYEGYTCDPSVQDGEFNGVDGYYQSYEVRRNGYTATTPAECSAQAETHSLSVQSGLMPLDDSHDKDWYCEDYVRDGFNYETFGENLIIEVQDALTNVLPCDVEDFRASWTASQIKCELGASEIRVPALVKIKLGQIFVEDLDDAAAVPSDEKIDAELDHIDELDPNWPECLSNGGCTWTQGTDGLGPQVYGVTQAPVGAGASTRTIPLISTTATNPVVGYTALTPACATITIPTTATTLPSASVLSSVNNAYTYTTGAKVTNAASCVRPGYKLKGWTYVLAAAIPSGTPDFAGDAASIPADGVLGTGLPSGTRLYAIWQKIVTVRIYDGFKTADADEGTNADECTMGEYLANGGISGIPGSCNLAVNGANNKKIGKLLDVTSGSFSGGVSTSFVEGDTFTLPTTGGLIDAIDTAARLSTSGTPYRVGWLKPSAFYYGANGIGSASSETGVGIILPSVDYVDVVMKWVPQTRTLNAALPYGTKPVSGASTTWPFTIDANNFVPGSYSSTADSATLTTFPGVDFALGVADNPTRVGYEFAGWQSTDSGVAGTYLPATGVPANLQMPNNNVSFDGKWNSNKLTLVFLSGGTAKNALNDFPDATSDDPYGVNDDVFGCSSVCDDVEIDSYFELLDVEVGKAINDPNTGYATPVAIPSVTTGAATYEFDCWFSPATNFCYSPGETPTIATVSTSKIYLTAKWRVQTSSPSVHFNVSSGFFIDSAGNTVAHDSVEPPTGANYYIPKYTSSQPSAGTVYVPIKKGYTFTGWKNLATGKMYNNQNACTNIDPNPTASGSGTFCGINSSVFPLLAPIYLTAQYALNTTTVKYVDAANVSVGASCASVAETAAGTQYALSEYQMKGDPTCLGYEFAGWKVRVYDSNNNLSSAATSATGKSYTSQMAAITYKSAQNGGWNSVLNTAGLFVNYWDPEANGGSGDALQTYPYTRDTSWYAPAASNSGTPVTRLLFPVGEGSVHEFEPVFVPIQHPIYYDASSSDPTINLNGCVQPATTIGTGEKLVIDSCVPTRTGFTFKGWKVLDNNSVNVEDGKVAGFGLSEIMEDCDFNASASSCSGAPLKFESRWSGNFVDYWNSGGIDPYSTSYSANNMLNVFTVPPRADNIALWLIPFWEPKTYEIAFDANIPSDASTKCSAQTDSADYFTNCPTNDNVLNSMPDQIYSFNDGSTIAQISGAQYQTGIDAAAGVASLAKSRQTLSTNEYSLPGYHFVGWNTCTTEQLEDGEDIFFNDCQEFPDERLNMRFVALDAGIDGVSVQGGVNAGYVAPLGGPNNNVLSLHAVWARNNFTISYNANKPGASDFVSAPAGASGAVSGAGIPKLKGVFFDTAATADDKIVLNQNSASPALINVPGWKFTGWSTCPQPHNTSTDVNSATGQKCFDYSATSAGGGWTFGAQGEWADYAAASLIPDENGTSIQNLFALWEQKSLNVRYNALGLEDAPAGVNADFDSCGSSNGGAKAGNLPLFDARVDDPANGLCIPSAPGYTFMGWSTSSTSTAAGPFLKPDSDYLRSGISYYGLNLGNGSTTSYEHPNLTLYAVFEDSSGVAVRFYDGSSCPPGSVFASCSPADISVPVTSGGSATITGAGAVIGDPEIYLPPQAHSSSVILPNKLPIRDGYVFGGYDVYATSPYSAPSGTFGVGAILGSNANLNVGTDKVYLVAKWTQDLSQTHTVKFAAAKGQGNLAGLNANEDGWAGSGSCENDYKNGAGSGFTATVTAPNAGENTNGEVWVTGVPSGVEYDLPSAACQPTKPGFNFVGYKLTRNNVPIVFDSLNHPFAYQMSEPPRPLPLGYGDEKISNPYDVAYTDALGGASIDAQELFGDGFIGAGIDRSSFFIPAEYSGIIRITPVYTPQNNIVVNFDRNGPLGEATPTGPDQSQTAVWFRDTSNYASASADARTKTNVNVPRGNVYALPGFGLKSWNTCADPASNGGIDTIDVYGNPCTSVALGSTWSVGSDFASDSGARLVVGAVTLYGVWGVGTPIVDDSPGLPDGVFCRDPQIAYNPNDGTEYKCYDDGTTQEDADSGVVPGSPPIPMTPLPNQPETLPPGQECGQGQVAYQGACYPDGTTVEEVVDSQYDVDNDLCDAGRNCVISTPPVVVHDCDTGFTWSSLLGYCISNSMAGNLHDPKLTANKTHVQAGEDVTIDGADWLDDSDTPYVVQIELHSTPVVLVPSSNVDSAGNFTENVIVPLSTPVGDHKIYAFAFDNSAASPTTGEKHVSAYVGVDVTVDPAPGTPEYCAQFPNAEGCQGGRVDPDPGSSTSGTCSNPAYTDQASCEAAGAQWTAVTGVAVLPLALIVLLLLLLAFAVSTRRRHHTPSS